MNWYKTSQGMKMIPTVKGKDFLNFIQRLGYQFARQNGSHQIWKHPMTGQTLSVPIHSPKKQMDKGNVKSVMKQMGLNGQQFGDIPLLCMKISLRSTYRLCINKSRFSVLK